jgi:hypothetical protein
MSTVVAIAVAICAAGMLASYYWGYNAGKREGFEAGRDQGKKEGSVKAFAVGYDRGRHDRDVKKPEEAPQKRGCLPTVVILAALVLRLIVLLD